MTSETPQFRLGDGSESAHWYRAGDEDKCAYQILGKNGKWRQTNLRDARQWGLLPSVSAITRIEAAPGLEKYKRRQAALAATTLPGIDEIGSEKEWFAAIEKDGAEAAKDAAKEGTAIHAAVEGWFSGERTLLQAENLEYIDGAAEAVLEIVGTEFIDIDNFHTETAVTHPYGFGGRCDLYTNGIVIDFKSKEFGRSTKLDVYANQGQALAAYREALGLPDARCFNIYLSRNNPGLYRVCEHPQDKLANYWEQFVALLNFWQIKNNMPNHARAHYETSS